MSQLRPVMEQVTRAPLGHLVRTSLPHALLHRAQVRHGCRCMAAVPTVSLPFVPFVGVQNLLQPPDLSSGEPFHCNSAATMSNVVKGALDLA